MNRGAPRTARAGTAGTQPPQGPPAPNAGGQGPAYWSSDGRGTKRLLLLVAAVGAAGMAALAAAIAAAPESPAGDSVRSHLPPPPAARMPGAGGDAAASGRAQPLNEFAFDLYRAAAGGGGSNVFFSPLSVRTAFSALYEGAGGRTALQISDALRIDADPDARHGEARRAADALAGRNDSSEIALANALWIDDGFALYGPYLEAARGAYNASVETVDFGDAAGAARRINGWTSNITDGLIRELVSEEGLDGTTAMVISNAIYFKGGWATPFPRHATEEGPFARGDGSVARAEFMVDTGRFGHVAYDGYQVLRVPYQGDRLSMLIVLPDDEGGLGRVAEGLSAGALNAWMDDMVEKRRLVAMPKFTVEARYDLKQTLGGMGVTDAFDASAADLPGIGAHRDGGFLYVSDATHVAYVGVDEEGTVAAAATGITVRLTSKPPSFVADHPFMFLIHDSETGSILFMGSIADPS